MRHHSASSTSNGFLLLPQKAVVGLVGEGNHGVCQVSSRTDAGVHALANVRTPPPTPPQSHVET